MAAGGYFDRSNGVPALEIAYADISAAFDDFLRRRGDDQRPILLASHSQGTALMERLLLERFATKTDEGARLRELLVAAYLVGMKIHDG